MGILIMVGQLVLSLSILIILHELGHFLPARFFNTRVEKFYLFFDPWFSLFKVKKGDTEYGIGWLPLGGYVKISGMIDESMDREQMKQPPQPWEFRSKPAWQRLVIMLGGVTVNFILGFLIYAMVLNIWGEEYLPAKNAVHGIYPDSLGQVMGLEYGDQVLAVGDIPFEKMDDRQVFREIIINDVKTVKIKRNGQTQTLNVPEGFVGELSAKKNKGKSLFSPLFPFVVDSIPAKGESPSREAGLLKNDRIISIDGISTPYYQESTKVAFERKGQKINLGLLRGRDTLYKDLTPTEKGRFGLFAKTPYALLGSERQEYGLAAALPAGVKKGVSFLTDQVKAFGQIFRGKIKASESLGGFGTFAKLFGEEWIWERFWSMTAAISLILAFMNLLPIPALDGGHVMFLLYEVVTGRKPSDKFMEYATIVGFVLVLSLVLYANFLDFFR